MEVRRISNDELQHMGIIGMKWGVRRYQNEDGTLTAAGRARYGYGAPRAASVGTTKVVRKAGDSKYREFRSTDSNYSLVSLSNRTPNIYKSKSYNNSVDEELSNVLSKLDKTITDEHFLREDLHSGKPLSAYQEKRLNTILNSNNLKDEVMDSTRITELCNIALAQESHKRSSKERAVFDGRVQQNTYKAVEKDPRLRRS